MSYRLFIVVLAFFIVATTARAQDSCLQITKLPRPDKPTERIIVADEIGVGLLVEFKSTGSLGSISPIKAGLDRKVDSLVLDAASRIEFRPKYIEGKPLTVEREINYRYSYTKKEWTISPEAGRCLTQTELLTDSEENILKATAKEFITAWTQSHDLKPLLTKWFVPQFTPFISSPEISFLPNKLFPELTPNERQRVFVSFWNYTYLQVVIMQSKPKSLECWDESPDCEAKRRQSMLRVLSESTVSRIEASEKQEQEPKTKFEVLKQVAELEKIFDEALPVLKVKNLEQTSEFKYWISLAEDDWNLNYLIKGGTADRDYKDGSGQMVVFNGDKVFGVETPLIIRIDFVKRGNTFKIFNLGIGDGD